MAKENNEQFQQSAINIISTTTSVKGDVSSEGDLRIDGKVEGNLNIKGRLVIGQNALIKGNIQCLNADISGNIEGNIECKELLSLKASSKVTGDISVSRLSIENGSNFTGKCSMITTKSV